MEIYALLPMKEHSERVPEKNFRLLKGRPMFCYVADTLKETGLFTKLVVNTDSEHIAELVRENYGDWSMVIKRPDKLRGDFVSMNDVISYDIQLIGEESYFFQTHSTSPFLTKNTINNAVKMYLSKCVGSEFDSLFSVNKYKSRFYDKEMRPINHKPEELLRTQDLEPVYEENSNFYLFSGGAFKGNDNNRIGKRPLVYEMASNNFETLDIDEMSDWKFAELLIETGGVN